MKGRDIMPAFALGLALLTGCGASALEVHTRTAAGLHAAAKVYQTDIAEEVRRDARRIYDACVARGSRPADCRVDAARHAERLRPWTEAGNMLARAVMAYIDAILDETQRDGGDAWGVALARLADVVDAYRDARQLAAALGVDPPPDVPGAVVDMLGSDR